jgi:hypothetical protein
MSNEKDQAVRRKGITGLAIPAGLLIGMGTGHAVGDLTGGLFIGLGIGFAVMLVLRIRLGEW